MFYSHFEKENDFKFTSIKDFSLIVAWWARTFGKVI